ETGAVSIVDGAQSTPHMPVDVKEMGCDFFVLTGHKMLGPNGIGALYGREDLLLKMRPFNYGGDMIREVHKENSEWNDLPYKFEAGTPNATGSVGLGAAVDYLKKIGMEEIRKHEIELNKFALDKLSEIEKLEIYGPSDPKKRGGLVAFNIQGVHSHDVAAILNEEGIAIRVGNHCAMPLHQRLNVASSDRASFYLYTTKEEIEILVEGLAKVKKIFSA
ncbi:aminotransferase class V-fold PLP-dependent enzyme, partial [Candidatus Micrarchaeota archaeon]|nr:aminotransferase class V-fold PLP-dependent enzyme [Candidatus Micrarchaeota archaeon]